MINFGNNTLSDLGLFRTSYLTKIEAFIGTKLYKVLVGQMFCDLITTITVSQSLKAWSLQ